ncbi:MAG TPA: demethoxyubiquinone hydroxylase family protein [Dongiaceae bacterium]|nr:demethoxyubiquinone hydroxylase family protein [Dongiaceae bacterium]
MVKRILRVNHAGEQGAIAIYGAQIARAKLRYPDLLPWLEETLGHEKKHRDTFLALMSTRMVTPCPAVRIWSVGGAMLGFVTALFGRHGVVVCTAAVERTVHKHLVEQITYLQGHDDALADNIRQVQVEEDAHLAFAEANHDPRAPFARILSVLVEIVTEILIWLATRGDSARLGAVLRAEHAR